MLSGKHLLINIKAESKVPFIMLYRTHTCPDKFLSRMTVHTKDEIRIMSPELQERHVGKNSPVLNDPSIAPTLCSFSPLTEHDSSSCSSINTTTTSSAFTCGSYSTTTTSRTISSSIPIPARSYLSLRSPVVQEENDLLQSEREYALSTWRMYHLIRSYRRSNKISNTIEFCDRIPDHYTNLSRNIIINNGHENRDNQQRNVDNNGIFELEI